MHRQLFSEFLVSLVSQIFLASEMRLLGYPRTYRQTAFTCQNSLASALAQPLATACVHTLRNEESTENKPVHTRSFSGWKRKKSNLMTKLSLKLGAPMHWLQTDITCGTHKKQSALALFSLGQLIKTNGRSLRDFQILVFTHLNYMC